jgi:hypothetical protein
MVFHAHLRRVAVKRPVDGIWMERTTSRDQVVKIHQLVQRVDDVDALIHRAIPQVPGAPTANRRGPRLPGRQLSRQVEGTHVDKALGSVHDRLALATRLLRTVRPELQVDSLSVCVERATGLLNGQEHTSRAKVALEDNDTRENPSPPDMKALDETAVWLLDHDLECAIVELGHPEHLRICLNAELQRDPAWDEPHRQLSQEERVEFGDLRDLLGGVDPSGALVPTDRISQAGDRAIGLLVQRYSRAHDNRHRVARELMRRQLLTWTAFGLTFLVSAFAVLIEVSVHPGWAAVPLALVSGMLGSMLSGMRRLRDELQRIWQIDAFRSAFYAQLAAGAGLGLLALVLFDLGILPVITGGQATEPASASPDERTTLILYALYGFAAGFSEPFVIGAIQRIVGNRS